MSRVTIMRLQKEEKEIMEDRIPNIIIARSDLLQFHFCFYALSQPYENGYYHGKMVLSEDYPFSPPSISMFTPSGRFETNRSICTTFTSYHKEKWSVNWNIKTMLIGLLSFMFDKDRAVGVINNTDAEKMCFASKSLTFNLKNPLFVSLFTTKFLQIGINFNLSHFPSQKEISQSINSQQPLNNHQKQQFQLFLHSQKQPIIQQIDEQNEDKIENNNIRNRLQKKKKTIKKGEKKKTTKNKLKIIKYKMQEIKEKQKIDQSDEKIQMIEQQQQEMQKLLLQQKFKQ